MNGNPLLTIIAQAQKVSPVSVHTRSGEACWYEDEIKIYEWVREEKVLHELKSIEHHFFN